jgi:hypothetical protein
MATAKNPHHSRWWGFCFPACRTSPAACATLADALPSGPSPSPTEPRQVCASSPWRVVLHAQELTSRLTYAGELAPSEVRRPLLVQYCTRLGVMMKGMYLGLE